MQSTEEIDHGLMFVELFFGRRSGNVSSLFSSARHKDKLLQHTITSVCSILITQLF